MFCTNNKKSIHFFSNNVQWASLLNCLLIITAFSKRKRYELPFCCYLILAYFYSVIFNALQEFLKNNVILCFSAFIILLNEPNSFKCQSGITLDQVLQIIVPAGWFLPVTPGTKFITIGGAIASDVHGKNHHVDGCFSRHIVEMDIFLADGSQITCSPSNHTDIFEATCGGMGLTGLISRVVFNLKKIETSYIVQKQIKAANLDEVLRLFDEYSHYTYSVAWIDCLKKGKNFGRSILMLGEHAKLSELSEKQRQNPLALQWIQPN